MYEGIWQVHNEPRARVFTIEACCIFIGWTKTAFFRNRKDDNSNLQPACLLISEIIRTNKFEGAVAGIYNANIISRDLGLAEVTDHKSTDGSMSPKDETKANLTVDFSQMSKEALVELHKALPPEGAEQGDNLFGPIKEREGEGKDDG